MNKLYVYVPTESFVNFKTKIPDDLIHLTHGIACGAHLDNGDMLSIIHPKSYGAIQALQNYGCTVLLGMHEPIGQPVADLLKHVKALPTETMRQVALRLHTVHGPAFHPDT